MHTCRVMSWKILTYERCSQDGKYGVVETPDKISRPTKLEWMANQVIRESGLTVGRKFDLDDLKLCNKSAFRNCG